MRERQKVKGQERGCKQELEKTTSFISRAALIVKTANAKKKREVV